MPKLTHLKRELGLFSATSLVIGCVVGSGIFVSSAGMARALGNAPLLLAVWVAGGLFTLLGALTQCELVGMMPGTGGLYTYLREIYGEVTGFFYGWAQLTVGNSGSIAAIAYTFAIYLGEFVTLPQLSPALEQWPLYIPYLGTLFPFKEIGIKIVAGSLICGLTYLNINGVKLGSALQTASASAKVLALITVVAAAVILGPSSGASTAHWFESTSAYAGLSGWAWIAAVVAALSSAFWAYDGWGSVAYIGDEVKDARKNLPRAIILGSLSFIALYFLMNLAYLYVLPVEAIGIAVEDRVASAMVSKVLGQGGAALIALLVVLCTFDSVNSGILTCARVYYAMAQEGQFLKSVAKVHPKYGTPSNALLLQCACCLVLLFSGSFDLLIGMYVFVSWLIYLLMGVGVFVMRLRDPKRTRPFRVPGYPWVPLLFVFFALAFVVLTLAGDIGAYASHEVPVIRSVMGLLFVFTGLPMFFYLKVVTRYRSDRS